ncbi:MAG: hypothetical protein K2H09_09185, partial [Treponemataceae bacterium]|nr:hypothetical protein [Treponemataceae bacterium]
RAGGAAYAGLERAREARVRTACLARAGGRLRRVEEPHAAVRVLPCAPTAGKPRKPGSPAFRPN